MEVTLEAEVAVSGTKREEAGLKSTTPATMKPQYADPPLPPITPGQALPAEAIPRLRHPLQSLRSPRLTYWVALGMTTRSLQVLLHQSPRKLYLRWMHSLGLMVRPIQAFAKRYNIFLIDLIQTTNSLTSKPRHRPRHPLQRPSPISWQC